MEEVLNFRFLGVPTPKQSFKYGTGIDKLGNPYVRKYQPSEIVTESKTIASQVIEQIPLTHKPWTGPIMIRMQFVFPPTSGWSKKKLAELKDGKRFYKTTKPDVDNLQKLVFDAMQGRVYINDSQICNLFVEKIYGQTPKTEISLKHLGLNNG